MAQGELEGSVPESAMARAATLALQKIHSTLVFNHASRVFRFGVIVSARRGICVDADLLYVGAMFYQFSLSSRARSSAHPLEITSANAARAFLETFHIAEQACVDVWDAIALSVTPTVSSHKSSLARTLQYGIETDLFGMHFCEVDPRQRQQALLAFPREADFGNKMINAIGAALLSRPDVAYGNLYSDILERLDPSYRRPNFCGRILGSDWADDL